MKYPDILLEAGGFKMKAVRGLPWKWGTENPDNFIHASRGRYDLYVDDEHRGFIIFPSGPNTHWELIAIGATSKHAYRPKQHVVLTPFNRFPSQCPFKKAQPADIMTLVPELMAKDLLPTFAEIEAFSIQQEAEAEAKRIVDAAERERSRIEDLEKSKQAVVDHEDDLSSWRDLLDKLGPKMTNRQAHLVAENIKALERDLSTKVWQRNRQIEKDEELRADRAKEGQ